MNLSMALTVDCRHASISVCVDMMVIWRKTYTVTISLVHKRISDDELLVGGRSAEGCKDLELGSKICTRCLHM